ncbi:DUF4625 domain-containing protein [Tenacibaculum xiamenense]|uniref:DUF4625 domain-containing protein n=1 Tax=Tenacibaculum xiamenense TaxID=1261553 RepID=UPI003893BCBD
MKTMKKLGLLLLITIITTACSSNDEEPDTTKPTITVQYQGGFPQSCDVLEKGNEYILKLKVADNISVEKYAVDIHHNFDHHTHDDQGAQCELDPIKTPINAFLYRESFTISNSPKEYEINQKINIPNDVDSGDYHCSISVIDGTGWQSRTSIDIKIQ